MPPKARAREVFKDLKYFNGVPVPGVSVGFCNVRKTLSKADGTPDYTLRVGEGPIITGVTAILPRPKEQAPLPVL
ncbi:hypothetical protein M427DRAFT_476143 [Gonapodya prolifera JEL478]|uniref:Uncharacterized protein n=1 Tax=Gonapodya prolifera (strain JEL478) TaxID=1344416 RepID=A0A139A1D6_GONPJ|nr:hypothetical protein M427DRAFT_476143 [Gonapodya prolifera JEL478]|eukprot:KXS10596.1 hypothetical protein M427DRAFT_476143 [Gonapodya prolifera JEL478]